MLKILRNLTLSALVGLGTIAAIPAAAEAASGSVYLGFGSGQNQGINFRFDDRGRHHYRGERHRSERHHSERRGHGSRYMRECSPREALGKASRMGLRRARIVDVNRRTIRVAGRSNGHRPATFIFGKAPSCPILR